MSTNLHWRPVAEDTSLDCDYGPDLKSALREEYPHNMMTLDHEALPFLRGLRAARVKGASHLIELVEKHGEIEVWEQS